MKIALNNEINIDLEKLISGKLLAQAGSGGGKSYLIRRLLEQSFGKIQHIILDTEGEFSSLREKYDYILIGKGYDIAADPKTAALMALRLWEEGVSAIIDLYELDPEDRQKFVDSFVAAMINAPKKLWRPVMLVIDEAHEYAPESEQSKYGIAMQRLASKGRKRKILAVFATQSIAQLSKRIVASCKNKLIGYASETNDVKRAAFELGMTPQEGLALRDLDPGEFYAFGPAISKKVIKVKVGMVKTKHEETTSAASKPAPASNKIKKALARLADLPAEAAKEATTIAELKSENVSLKRELRTLPQKTVQNDPKMVEKALLARDLEWKPQLRKADDEIKRLTKIVMGVSRLVGNIETITSTMIDLPKSLEYTRGDLNQTIRVSVPVKEVKEWVGSKGDADVPFDGINGPEQRILDAIALSESIGIMEPEQTAVAFLAGYTYGGGGFNNPRGALKTKKLVEYRGSRIALTEAGRAFAHAPETPLSRETMRERVMSILPGPEQKLLGPLMDAYPDAMTNEALAEASGYTNGSGGFNNPKSRLRTLGLIDYPSSGHARAKELLFP